jgi:hypothetical protein
MLAKKNSLEIIKYIIYLKLKILKENTMKGGEGCGVANLKINGDLKSCRLGLIYR